MTGLLASLALFLLLIFIFIGLISYDSKPNNGKERVIPPSPPPPQQNSSESKESKLRALRLAHIDAMNGHEFEHYVSRLLVSEGYTSVEVTRGSGDCGADVLASKNGIKYAIQVKRQQSNVSRRAVSDAVGALRHYSCDSAMVITNNYLSKQSKHFASSVGCDVVDRDILAVWISRYSGLDVAAQFEEKCFIPNSSSPSDVSPQTNIQSKVILSTDDSDSVREVGSESVASDIVSRVKKFARKQYPNDYEMQEYTFNEQIEAYKRLRHLKSGIPSVLFEQVNRAAIRDYPNDFEMQLHKLKEQDIAYQGLQTFSAFDVPSAALMEIRERAARDYKYDYEMQLYKVSNEVESYRRLEKIG